MSAFRKSTCQTIAAVFATLVIALGASLADTVILKSGVKLEGKLISQNAETIRFEVGKSVKQVRVIKRSDIASLDVIPADKIAFESIKALLPTPDLMEVQEYRRLIDGAPKNFLKAFPDSEYSAEVDKIVAALEEERAKVIAGGVKIDGKWITKEQIAADPYNHEAKIALSSIKTRFEKEELLGGLREFHALEGKFGDSTSYPVAIGIVKEVLPKHAARLASQLVTSTRRNTARERDYARMGEEERKKALAAYNKVLDKFLKKHEADKKAKKKWRDFHVWDLASIKDAQEEAKKEQARLAGLDLDALNARAKSLEEAAASVAASDFEKASKLIADGGKAAEGSFAATLKQKIDAGMKEAADKAARAKAAEEREARRIEREKAAAAAKLAADERAKARAEAAAKAEGDPEPDPGSDPETTRVGNAGPGTDPLDPYDEEDEVEEEEESSGLSLLTLLLVLIPIMGIVSFIALRSAKGNQVEDFVPAKTDDGGDSDS